MAQASGHVHSIFRVPDDGGEPYQVSAVHSTDITTRDTDLWEEQEQVLVSVYTDGVATRAKVEAVLASTPDRPVQPGRWRQRQPEQPAMNDRERELWWTPGTYRVVTHAAYSGARIGEIERPMPLPEGYARLGKTPHDGLPARGFALTVLSKYPNTTLAQVGEHIKAFGRHYLGEISTAELTELTGYALPDGAYRPHRPDVIITEDNR